MPQTKSSMRKKATPPYRQKFVWGVVPVPGSEFRNPPVNHHGVDLIAMREKIELNRASIHEARLVYPGLGVSKHPMTIATLAATYIVGWASYGGIRSISTIGGDSFPRGRILFLQMDEPMVFTGQGETRFLTEPVIFIGRRHYDQIDVPEMRFDEPAQKIGKSQEIWQAA